MTRTIGRLEAQGFVARRTDEADGRLTVVHLTDAGRQLWRDVDQCGRRVRERALQGMDDATRAQLTRLLEQARDNLLSQD